MACIIPYIQLCVRKDVIMEDDVLNLIPAHVPKGGLVSVALKVVTELLYCACM